MNQTYTAAPLYPSGPAQTWLFFLSSMPILRYQGLSYGMLIFSLDPWIAAATVTIVVHLLYCCSVTLLWCHDCFLHKQFGKMLWFYGKKYEENTQIEYPNRQKVTVDQEQDMCKCSFIWKKAFIIFNKK